MDHHQEETVPEGALLALLNVKVQAVPDNPESPSPALSDDGNLFMNIYDRAELLLLKYSIEHTRFLRGGDGYLVVEPLIFESFKGLLQFLYGPQWEDKFLRGGYVSGYYY